MEFIILFLIILAFIFDMWLSILNYKNKGAKIPDEVSDVYNKDEYEKWLKYNMENFRISFIVKSIRILIVLGLLVFNIFPKIYDLAGQINHSRYPQLLLFLGILFLASFIFDIFISYYRQFSIEQRYGFNKSTFKTFIGDQIKGFIISIILGGGIIYILSLLYYNVGQLFYLFAWLVIVAIILFVNLFYIKIFIPIFNKLRPLEDGELKTKIINFAKKVGYEISKISIIDASRRSTKLNAFFGGLGKFKQVVLYDTLLDKMTDDQIVSVLAHEIGHSKRNHIIKNLILSLITISIMLFVLVYTINSDAVSTAFGFTSKNYGFGLIVFLLLLSPISIFLDLITSHISRKFEYQADRYAAENGFKNQLIESLKILNRENFSNLTPHPLYVAMRYSHPPVTYRIRAINQVEEN